MARTQASMPKRSTIATAWMQYGNCHGSLPWGNEMMDWGEPQCWACSYYAHSWEIGSLKAWDKANGLDRCHVIPYALGGTDDPLNIVLMCAACHRDSPDHKDPQFLFDWMRRQPKRVQGKWLPAHIEQMTHLISDALSRMTETEATAMTKEAIREFMNEAGHHYGHLSDGTRSAALEHLRRKLAKEGT